MSKTQCPKCKQAIELSALRADDRIRCSNCKAEFAVKKPIAAQAAAGTTTAANKSTPTAAKPAQATGGSSGAAHTAARSNARQPDPSDPFASIDLHSLGKPRRVDFGVPPAAGGVVESPQGNSAPWLPGNSVAYVPLSEEEAGKLTRAAGKPGSKPAMSTQPMVRRKSNLGITLAVISLLVLMAGGAIVAAVIVAKSGTRSNAQQGASQ